MTVEVKVEVADNNDYKEDRSGTTSTVTLCNSNSSIDFSLHDHNYANLISNLQESTNVSSAQVCEMCGKTFTRRESLRLHQRIHSGLRHICTLCGKTFSQTGSLKRHLLIHTGYKPYKCSECGHGFLRKSHLLYHMATHAKDRPLECTGCIKLLNAWKSDSRSVQANSISRNITLKRQMHGSRICHSEAFEKGRRQSSRHVITSQEVDASANDVGVKSDASNIQLKSSRQRDRKITDDNVDSYECDQCGGVTTAEDLERLVKVLDSIERQYKCSICNKTFDRSYDLKRHIKTHSGIKPYSCKECGEEFTREHNMKRHMTRHTNKSTRHVCNICGKSFSQADYLCVHVRNNHSDKQDKTFPCRTCEKAFITSRALRLHERTHTDKRLKPHQGSNKSLRLAHKYKAPRQN